MLKSKAITITGKTYEIPFPNVGQMMEIESFKLTYTKGKYIQLATSDLKGHVYLLDLTDALAYFSILLPELKKDLNVADWWAIDPFLGKELTKVYRNEFTPWLAPILKDLYNFDEKVKVPDNGENTNQ